MKPLVHAYNCTRCEVTGFTPYKLMFGRQPHLPVDVAFGLPVKEGQQKSHLQYVKNLRSHLEESYKIATKSAAKVAEKNKTSFDKRITPSVLDIGYRALVKNVRIRGKHKLADKWESTVHVVVKRASDLLIYTVKPETGEGPLRTLHRDLLLPCGFLPKTTEVCAQPKPVDRRKTRQSTRSDKGDVDQSSDDHSSDEDESVCVTWSLFKPVPEETRCIVSQNVPRHRHPGHFENNLTTNLNVVTDDVPTSADSLPDVTPVNHKTQNLDLLENKSVDVSQGLNLPEN